MIAAKSSIDRLSRFELGHDQRVGPLAPEGVESHLDAGATEVLGPVTGVLDDVDDVPPLAPRMAEDGRPLGRQASP
jgi:hypothetical protein